MLNRIAVVGAGAVGGYIAGKLAAAGRDVVAIDTWIAHIERIRSAGLTLKEPGGAANARLEALHISDVQSLVRKPVDVALICTKSYDTAWAAKMIEPYLAPEGCAVSIQNSLNEEQIAGVVGWERTLGCIASTISVVATGPGEITRVRTPGGSTYTVFRVGEAHGRVTPRATSIAELLSNVDSSKVTTNLWGERWAKLTTNSMHHGILGSAGISDHDLMKNTATRRLAIRCAGEAIRVAQALGHPLEPILRMPASLWLAAARNEKPALAELEAGWIKWMERSKEPHYGSIGQDLSKGRRTEIDYVCGYVAAKGESVGVPAPTQDALYRIVKRVERGEIAQSMDNIASLLATVDVAQAPSPAAGS
ncbi:MAG TPA: 2-dehydropantoate 2-reductase [Burkholderiales bacterium]|nr:2-dehydropantoate 2-reductase [Burkholderiales bacterium]